MVCLRMFASSVERRSDKSIACDTKTQLYIVADSDI